MKFENRNVDELAPIVDEKICIETLKTSREYGNMVGLQKKCVEAANRRGLRGGLETLERKKLMMVRQGLRQKVPSGYVKSSIMWSSKK